MITNSNTAQSWRALAGAIVLAASLSAPASHAADPFEMEWRELARGVWVGVRPVSYRSPVMTNTTVVIGDKGVLVFDAAGLAIQGERLVEKVAELTDKPITHIAISHWHGDHSMGDYKVLEKFPAAEVISHEFTARYNASPNGEKVEPRDVKGENEYRARGREGARHGRPLRRHAGHAADARLLRRAARALRLRQRGGPAPGRSRRRRGR